MRPGAGRLTRLALMAAMMCILSQFSIPTPWGMPLTLQTVGAGLCGYMLGPLWGSACMGVYLALGAAGLPVFSLLGGGLGVLMGPTGGYLLGFLPLAALCGLGGGKKGPRLWALSALGLGALYLMGSAQFAWVTGRSLWEGFLLSGAPYLVKDFLSLWGARKLWDMVQKRLSG